MTNHFSHSYSIVDKSRGTNEGDVWPGTAFNDRYFGLGGTDTISGYKGNDQLHGGAGIDILDGEEDNDQLFGDADNDFLTGGYGNDVMTGGAGQDTFYQYTDYSIGIHTDKITDFVAAGKHHEVVIFVVGLHYEFNGLADIKDHMKQDGGDVRFNYGEHNFLIIEHTRIAEFTTDDFQF